MQGFKSFADKISLEFESGVTTVVGPNGSGKSNIADAVRWVLGEQSAKTLRGNKMEDIIFSGTEHRKPVNFAEVCLVLDNCDRALPVEYTEVSISRRIFRSGESEYYINKSMCRLKDIYELFMDTGVGRDGYSIIGQGRIDEILSSKSEDRRSVFEEASGITKYKTRKLEAERKLEATKQNLVRINDIISELEYQIEPLKEQSDKAKEYLELAENLKVLDINIFIDTYNKLKEKLEICKLNYSDIEVEYNECLHKIESLDLSSNQQDEKNKQLENDILCLNQKVFEIEKNIEKIYAQVNLSEQKVNNNEENKLRLEKEIEGYQESIKGINEELNARVQKLEELSLYIQSINQEVLKNEEKLRIKNESIENNFAKIEDLKSEIFEKHNEVSNKKGNINSLNVLLDNIRSRKSQIGEELDKLKNERIEKQEQYNIVATSIVKIKDSIDVLVIELENHRLEKEKLELGIKDNIGRLERLK